MSTSTSTPPRRDLVDALEQVLAKQLEGHRAMLECLQRKRQAIRNADLEVVSGLCGMEQALLGRLEKLEEERRRLLADLARDHGTGGLTLRDLAARVSEPQCGRLQVLAAALGEVVPALSRESSIVRAAADALSRHMQGVMQSVRATLTRAGVYGRRGALTDPAHPLCTLDIRS